MIVSIEVSIILEVGVLVLMYGCYLQPSLHTTILQNVSTKLIGLFAATNYGKHNFTTN